MKTSYLAIVGGLIAAHFLAVPGNAAQVLWQSSTNAQRWADKGVIQTAAWDNDPSTSIQINEQTLYQEIDGFGGCFNELGWDAMTVLSSAGRDSVIKALFDTSGCRLNLCRVPIGANDYAMDYYSLDDSPGDYAMTNFSMTRDRLRLVPYIKTALAYNRELKIGGAPWCPPSWMMNPNNASRPYVGSMKQAPEYLSAYALYLSKFVQAYRAEGIPVIAIFNQNEPEFSNNVYPQCSWNGTQLRDFVKNYLGPQFKRDMLCAMIMHGPFYSADWNGLISPAFTDTIANSHLSGIGCQYDARNILQQMHQTYPQKRIFETESPAGGGGNAWGDGEYIWSEIKTFLSGGSNAYMHWNMVLDQTGKSSWGWVQNAMITVNRTTKSVTYSGQYYAQKHFSYYVKPGAYRVSATGGYADAMAFRNPDGENVLVLRNATDNAATVAVNFNGQKIKPSIPSHSFNTFRIPGTPLPGTSAFSRIEAEAYAIGSGVYNKSCSEGGSCLGLIENGDFAVYHNIDFGAGAKSFEARVASTIAGGSMEIRLDSCTGALAGTCIVPNTAGAWSTVSCAITNATGRHKLYLRFLGPAGTANLFSLNWFDFSQTATAAISNQARFGIRQSSRTMFAMITNRRDPLQSPVVVYDLAGKKIGTFRDMAGIRDLSGAGVYIANRIPTR